MNKDNIEQILATFKGTKQSFPFGPDVLVFKVMHKLFALVSQNANSPQITLKCNPADAIVLTSQFEAVVPGYHMNKKHWITITLNGDCPESMINDLANGSYQLVVSNLIGTDKLTLEKL